MGIFLQLGYASSTNGSRFRDSCVSITDSIHCIHQDRLRARSRAIGTGDTELYIFAGMIAAVVISVRVFLFKGAGKAN